MIKKTLTAIIAATALFGLNANSFAAGFFDAWFGPTSSAWLEPELSIDVQDVQEPESVFIRPQVVSGDLFESKIIIDRELPPCHGIRQPIPLKIQSCDFTR